MSISQTGRKHDEETIQKMKDKAKQRQRKIICLETNEIFDSIKEAKKWLGKGDILSCLKGKTKCAGRHPNTGEKLHWMYYEEWLEKNKDLRI